MSIIRRPWVFDLAPIPVWVIEVSAQYLHKPQDIPSTGGSWIDVAGQRGAPLPHPTGME